MRVETVFWPPQATGIYVVHSHARGETHTHKIKINNVLNEEVGCGFWSHFVFLINGHLFRRTPFCREKGTTVSMPREGVSHGYDGSLGQHAACHENTA